MSLSQTDLDRLENALAKGTLTVEVDGRRITYRSVSELQAAIGYVKNAIASSTAQTTQSFAKFCRD